MQKGKLYISIITLFLCVFSFFHSDSHHLSKKHFSHEFKINVSNHDVFSFDFTQYPFPINNNSSNEEDNSKDDDNQDDEALHNNCHHELLQLILSTNNKINGPNTNFGQHNIIPLYVLFHTWKTYLLIK